MKRIVAITGTPGVGKSTFARKLALNLDARLIDVNSIVNEFGLFSGYDKDGAKLVELNALKKQLEKMIRSIGGSVVVEGHLLCEIKIKGASVIVLREHLETIKKRLLKRRYPVTKVRDNIVSEALDYCGIRSHANYAEVFEVMNDSNSLRKVMAMLNGRKARQEHIDMMNELEAVIKKDRRFAI